MESFILLVLITLGTLAILAGVINTDDFNPYVKKINCFLFHSRWRWYSWYPSNPEISSKFLFCEVCSPEKWHKYLWDQYDEVRAHSQRSK